MTPSGRCAACKHLRRRCPSDCIFAPYFPANDPRRFAYVHRIYGASNVAKILQGLPVSVRGAAAESLYKEAFYRVMDPVYGVVGMITVLHQQICATQCQLARVNADIAVAAAAAGNGATPAMFLPEQNGSHSSSYYDVSTWLN